MTPAEVISNLDAALDRRGEDILLQRLTLGPASTPIPFGVSCRAFVRGYKPDELVGSITQQDNRVILSPTEISAIGWPGPAVTPPGPGVLDRRVPHKGDRAVINGQVRNVEAATGIYMAGTLVRIEMQVRG